MYNYKIFHNFPPECEKILKDMENRSYRGVGQELGKSKTQIEKWARKYFF